MELTQNDLKMMAISVLTFTLQPRKLENQLISISEDLKNPTASMLPKQWFFPPKRYCQLN